MSDPWRCPVHRRDLSWWENRAGGCFWCDPALIPWDETAGRDGKGWDERRKVWREIRDLTPEARAALIPAPLPGPGVETPSQKMLRERHRDR